MVVEAVAEIASADARVIANDRRRSGAKHLAVGQYIDARAHLQGLTHIVVGQQHAHPALGEAGEMVGDAGRGAGVEAGEWLVDEQHSGGTGKGADELDAASLAAGEGLAAGGREGGEVEVSEQVGPALGSGGAGQVAQAGVDVFGDGEAAEDGGLLRHVAEPGARAAPERVAGNVAAVEADLAALGAQQAREHAEGGGLAGAIGAEQADDLAERDAEREVVHDDAAAEAAVQSDRDEAGVGVGRGVGRGEGVGRGDGDGIGGPLLPHRGGTANRGAFTRPRACSTTSRSSSGHNSTRSPRSTSVPRSIRGSPANVNSPASRS